jgi:NADPH-dependent 2,4-dienoyl-CoA reductase/sulfur reductase-like enzyme
MSASIQSVSSQDVTAKLAAPASPPVGLAALEARVRQDLSWLELPAKSWTVQHTHDGQSVLDVAIIGGGMAGSAAAAALKHVGVKAVIFDRSPAGFEGPWATTARMETLRSPRSSPARRWACPR